ncbi:transglycosylase SLT domain-containing protein [Nocardia wallacei]|uniref:transglycosylase SLT domain-containing protein n=1 Tax=Nocardia wallacei TaxID=480035 RepID=UPI002454FEF0|nr:transglycosylase SLT domain-containing protein [Nocardia wallacei]
MWGAAPPLGGPPLPAHTGVPGPPTAPEAEAKGIDGSDRVVAAKERAAAAGDRVADAQASVNQANAQVARAQQAVTDAQNAATPSAEKLAQALAKLSPEAAAFVTTAQELAPTWEAARKAIQDNLFEGLDDTLRDLADKLLPSVRDGMGAVATELNLGAKGFADFLTSGEGIAALDSVFASTADLLRGMREGSEGFLSGLSAMVQAAQPFALAMGQAFGGIATELGSAFTELANSGLLGEVLTGFTEALQGVGPLLHDLVLSFAGLAAEILPALRPLFESIGESLLILAPALGSLGDVFARSLAEVMPSLAEFIAALAKGMEPILPVLVELLKSLGAALTPLIGPLSQIVVTIGQALVGAIDALAPAMGPLAEAFAAILNAVAPLLPLLAESLTAVILALAPALTEVATALAPVIAAFAEQMGPVIAEIAPVLAEVAMTIGQALAGALIAIAPMLPELVGSFSNLLLAVVPLLPELARLAAEIIPPLIDVLISLTPFIIRAIDAFTWLVSNVIIPLVIPVFNEMKDQIVLGLTTMSDIFNWWNDVVTTVTGAVVGAWEWVSTKFTEAKDWIVDTVFKALGDGLLTVQGRFESGVRGISEKWAGLQEAAKAPVKFVVDTVWNNGLLKAWNAVVPFLPGIKPMETVTLPFARGGILPGYTPGRDVHRFVSVANPGVGLDLSGGEGIARPEVVRALGPGRWGAMNAAARAGGVAGVQRFFGFASGGVIPSTMWQLIRERFPAMQFTSGLRTEGNDFHTRNMAGDFATTQWPSAEMKATARWIYDTYGPESLELIHWPLDGWQNIDEGKPFDFGQPTNDQHRNHVHWAMDHPPGNPGDKPGGIFGALREGASRLFGSIRDRVGDAFDAALSGVADAIPAFGGAFGQLPRAIFDHFRTKAREFLTGRGEGEDEKTNDVPAGGDVEMWRGLVRDLLGYYQLPLALTNSTLRRMQQESSGRTDAINKSDINWQNGTPSVGLMQVIGPTYAAYKDPAFDKGPYLYGVSIDPAANVAASMRYVNNRYTGRGNTWAERLESAYGQPGGYQRGGQVPGVGTGDIVPALLEPHEIVMNRRAAQMFGPLLLSMNRAVPRFQTGGAVDGLLGGIGAVPVAVVNWEGARGILGNAAPAPPAAEVPAAAATTSAPAVAAAQLAQPTPADAAAAASAVAGAFGDSIARVVSDSLKALVDTATKQAAEQTQEQRAQDAAAFADGQARVDEQGRLISDTNALLERNASTTELVISEQTEQLREQLTDIANRVTGGVLAPIMESAVNAGIQVVQQWLGGVGDQITDGTDRTTTAVQNLDLGTSGGSAPAPFGAPGSAFDATKAISDAVVSVANTAQQAFMSVANDVAKAALAQQPSEVDESRGVLGKDISGGPLVDLMVRLTGVEIQVRDVLIDTLEEITEFRGDLFGTFDESGRLVSDTAALMQRNQSSIELAMSEQNRINRELIKAVLRYLIVSVVIPIMTAILAAMIQLAATAIGAAIGSVIPVIGTAIGAAIGAVVGAALAGVAAVLVGTLAVGAGAAIDSFDSGGVGIGKGLMVKDTALRERVLDPAETSSYDRLARIADMLEAPREHRTTVHAPMYFRGGERDADRVQDRLLSLMPK